jgi:hypothetical protein
VKIGDTFGRLTVLEQSGYKSVPSSKGRYPVFKCKCSCGNTTSVMSSRFRTIKSCGCLKKEALLRGRAALAKFWLPTGEADQNRIYDYYRLNSCRRGITFDISKEMFLRLIHQDCTYCGRPPHTGFKKHGHTYFYTGVDRTDNKKGYEAGNIVPCCGTCNRMKGILAQSEFIQHVQSIISHLGTGTVCITDVAPTVQGQPEGRSPKQCVRRK